MKNRLQINALMEKGKLGVNHVEEVDCANTTKGVRFAKFAEEVLCANIVKLNIDALFVKELVFVSTDD